MSRRVAGNHVRAAIAMAVILGAVLLALPAGAFAGNVYVSALGSDSTGDGSLTNPYATVQHGINMASVSDTVCVGAGTFVGDINMRDGVSLQGAGSSVTTLTGSGTVPTVIATTIGTTTTITDVAISGGISGIRCLSASSPNISDDNITGNIWVGIECLNGSAPDIDHDIVSGNGDPDHLGNGINCESSSAPSITNCTISGNAYRGIWCSDSSPTIANCTVSGNPYSGILCDASSPTITHNTFSSNTFGAVALEESSSPTITNNTISGNYGDGVECFDSSSPSIASNTITGNSNWGIECSFSSSPSINRNTITGNRGYGIACDTSSSPNIADNTISGSEIGIRCLPSCSPAITNNTISGNSYFGIWCWSATAPAIVGDVISQNTSDGIYCQNAAPTIVNCTISGNGGDGIECDASSSPVITNDTITGSSGDGISSESSSTPTVINCIVWGSGASDLDSCTASYSDALNGAGGIGNISKLPSFVDTATSDFHLDSSSPCIDDATSTGAPAIDKDGALRPEGNSYDMGAYEYRGPFHFALHYLAGAGGTLTGAVSQTVSLQASGTVVTATPLSGYHFVGWSDGLMAASRTDTFVTADATYTANFALNAVATKTGLKAPGTAKKGKALKLTGSVSPGGSSGSVVIYLYRLVGTKYKPMGTPSVKLKSSVFTYSFKPKYKGKWRFRADYLGSARCQGSWSGFAYTQVK
jgi:parallel beta-helix repeat protein